MDLRQQFLPPCQLLRHFLRAGGPGEIAFGHRLFKVEDRQRVALEGLVGGVRIQGLLFFLFLLANQAFRQRC